MPYNYGVPGQTEIGRPRCWGNPAEYNPDLRECRACTFQSSCRDNVVRMRNSAPYATQMPVQGYVPTGFQPAPLGYAPVAAPVYVPQPPPQRGPVPLPVHVQVVQPPPPPQVRSAALYPTPQQYDYGWLHDPMYQAMAACPPPVRPQLPGETFWERVMKNMFLAAGESFFMHGFLAMRQLVLPPEQQPQQPQQMEDVGRPPQGQGS